jgi:hypothetical protein
MEHRGVTRTPVGSPRACASASSEHRRLLRDQGRVVLIGIEDPEAEPDPVPGKAMRLAKRC